MKKNLILFLTVALLTGGAAVPVHAAQLTVPQVQAILNLLASFYTDQAVILNVENILRGTAPVTSGVAQNMSTPTTFAITRTLFLGVRGDDVTALQRFLISQGLLYSSATGYFGLLTQAAVQSFQAQHGIVSSGKPATTGYGVVGPKTRALLAQITTIVPSGEDASGTPAPGSGEEEGEESPASCAWNGQTVSSGQSVFAYQTATVPYGQTCAAVAQMRVCTGGALSGSYQYSACAEYW